MLANYSFLKNTIVSTRTCFIQKRKTHTHTIMLISTEFCFSKIWTTRETKLNYSKISTIPRRNATFQIATLLNTELLTRTNVWPKFRKAAAHLPKPKLAEFGAIVMHQHCFFCCCVFNLQLIGGFKPSDTYSSNWTNFSKYKSRTLEQKGGASLKLAKTCFCVDSQRVETLRKYHGFCKLPTLNS